jgi:hypothetical protein
MLRRTRGEWPPIGHKDHNPKPFFATILCLFSRTIPGTSRGTIIAEQHFVLTDGISCNVNTIIVNRVADRNILTWIQNMTGNY